MKNTTAMTGIVLSLLTVFLIVGCKSDDSSAKGFSLPEGDPQAGKLVFTNMGCNSCHSLPSVAQMPPSAENENQVWIKLGGEVRHIKTYGELVTAVINPSHKILQSYATQHTDDEGNSVMRNFNDVMSISQLIDLVSFLQTEYHLQPFERSQYRAYYPGSE